MAETPVKRCWAGCSIVRFQGRFRAGRFAVSRLNAGRFSGVSDGGIADVTTTFGALTSAGFGGVPVDGTSITAGDPGGHWEINGAGHLVPTGVGTLLGSYDLVTDTGQGVMVTITANEISARSETEIRDALLTASGGETVRLRNTGFAVPTVPLRLAENMNYASLVTLTREPGAVIQNLQVQAAVNLTLSNLDIHEINGSMVESALDLLGACDNVIVEDCDIHGVYRDPFGDYSDGSYANTFYGINCGFSNGSEPLSLTIRRNRIYDCRQGAIFIVEGAGGLTITDNEFYQLYTDGFQLAARDGGKDAPMVVERNYLHGFIGLGSDVGDPHVDAIQFASGQTITYSKVEIRQNIIKADLTESRAPAIQGITLFNHANTVTLKDAVIAGNVILTGGTNALVMSTMDGGVVVNNTVGVSALGAPDNGTGAIELGTIGSSGTIYVHNNIAEQVSLQGGATYDQGGNVELGDEGSTIAYATAFDGPAFTNPISFDQVKSRYAMKTGGPADHGGQNAGALNSGYGSFGAPRTASGWSHDPAYESFAPTVAPPPSVPDHWWDFSDAAQRSMSGDEITALSDKQGSGVDLSFASGERPELLNGRAALFDGTAQATFAAPFNIDADAHTLMLFGHLPGDNAQRAVLSGDQPWFITGLDSSNGATPSKVYALSSGARTGSVLEFSSYQFSAAYSDAAIIGNGVFYSASGPTEHVLGNGETTENHGGFGDRSVRSHLFWRLDRWQRRQSHVRHDHRCDVFHAQAGHDRDRRDARLGAAPLRHL